MSDLSNLYSSLDSISDDWKIGKLNDEPNIDLGIPYAVNWITSSSDHDYYLVHLCFWQSLFPSTDTDIDIDPGIWYPGVEMNDKWKTPALSLKEYTNNGMDKKERKELKVLKIKVPKRFPFINIFDMCNKCTKYNEDGDLYIFPDDPVGIYGDWYYIRLFGDINIDVSLDFRSKFGFQSVFSFQFYN